MSDGRHLSAGSSTESDLSRDGVDDRPCGSIGAGHVQGHGWAYPAIGGVDAGGETLGRQR
jgi:hypothetical protein